MVLCVVVMVVLVMAVLLEDADLVLDRSFAKSSNSQAYAVVVSMIIIKRSKASCSRVCEAPTCRDDLGIRQLAKVLAFRMHHQADDWRLDNVEATARDQELVDDRVEERVVDDVVDVAVHVVVVPARLDRNRVREARDVVLCPCWISSLALWLASCKQPTHKPGFEASRRAGLVAVLELVELLSRMALDDDEDDVAATQEDREAAATAAVPVRCRSSTARRQTARQACTSDDEGDSVSF